MPRQDILKLDKIGMESAPKDGTHIVAYGIHYDDCNLRNWGFCEIYILFEDGFNRGWYNICGYPSEPEYWIGVAEAKEGWEETNNNNA